MGRASSFENVDDERERIDNFMAVICDLFFLKKQNGAARGEPRLSSTYGA